MVDRLRLSRRFVVIRVHPCYVTRVYYNRVHHTCVCCIITLIHKGFIIDIDFYYSLGFVLIQYYRSTLERYHTLHGTHMFEALYTIEHWLTYFYFLRTITSHVLSIVRVYNTSVCRLRITYYNCTSYTSAYLITYYT